MTALLTAIGSLSLANGRCRRGCCGRGTALGASITRNSGTPFAARWVTIAWFPPSVAADASELETGGRRFLFLAGTGLVHLWLKCRDPETLRSNIGNSGQMLSQGTWAMTEMRLK